VLPAAPTKSGRTRRHADSAHHEADCPVAGVGYRALPMKFSALGSLLLLAACAAPAPAPVAPAPEPPRPAVANPRPPTPADDLAMWRTIVTTECACKTAACLDRFEKEYWPWLNAWGERQPKDYRPDAETIDLSIRRGDCQSAIMGRGSHIAFSARVAETSLSACDDYVKAFDAYEACDEVPPAQKHKAADTMTELNKEFEALSTEKRDAAARNCAGAAADLRHSAALTACKI
jgi:hypothetical protein